MGDLVLYEHDCKGSARHHLNKYKHWAKVVKDVDLTKTSGYAFIGDFLSVNREHKLEVGTVIVEVCNLDIGAYEITPKGKVCFATGKTSSMSAVIEEVARKLKEKAEKKKDLATKLQELYERREALLKELSFIEEQIKLLNETGD